MSADTHQVTFSSARTSQPLVKQDLRRPHIHIADMATKAARLGEETRVDKVNAELVTLTYGTIVAQLCKDYNQDYAQVNKQLDKMGYNMGMRLIEDFLAKSNSGSCSNLRETAEVISKVGFKMFLNITPVVTNWSTDNKSFTLLFDENPLADFVELPDDAKAQDELWYSNIFCGVLRGALEMVSSFPTSYPTSAHSLQVQMHVETHFTSDVLRGNDTTEMRVTLIRYIEDEMPPDDE
ncbi:TRAPP I complex [Aureobasidium subglaciale]|nr:TRAPP I complex [Aureobasidium subglaciale]KAI5274514.1 TRAPP I complex [Aureobasidium subglaciale]